MSNQVVEVLFLDGKTLSFSEVSIPLDSELLKGHSFLVPFNGELKSYPYVEAFGEGVDLSTLGKLLEYSSGEDAFSYVQTYDFGEEGKDYVYSKGSVYFVGVDEDNNFINIPEDIKQAIQSNFKVSDFKGVDTMQYVVDATG